MNRRICHLNLVQGGRSSGLEDGRASFVVQGMDCGIMKPFDTKGRKEMVIREACGIAKSLEHYINASPRGYL